MWTIYLVTKVIEKKKLLPAEKHTYCSWIEQRTMAMFWKTKLWEEMGKPLIHKTAINAFFYLRKKF